MIDENLKRSTTAAKFWEKTMNLRFHRLITSYSWSCQWDKNYTQTLQQEWICRQTGESKWEPIDIVEEEVPNIHPYG